MNLMKAWGILFIFAAATLCADLPYIKTLLPKTVEQVAQMEEDYEKAFDQFIDAFLEHLKVGKAADALVAWNEAATLTQVTRTKLGYLLPVELYPDMQVGIIAKQEYDKVNEHYRKKVGTQQFKEKVELFLKHYNKQLSPNELYFFTSLLGYPLEGTPYTFKRGKGKVRKGAESITVLNANVLFMPDGYTYFFGGVSPWTSRVDELSSLFQECLPDVLCLQEVHDEKSAAALFDKLQKDYPYFYFDIGQKNATTDPDAITMNSGLFVASMYPIKNPRFIPFEMEGRQEGINKGVFYGDLIVDRKAFCTLYTTHLNPFENESARKVREEEAVLIVKEMEKGKLPSLLVGDLNIFWGSDEWEHSTLKSKFINAYHASEGPTCTDYFNDLVWSEPIERKFIKKEGHICDYALIYEKHPLHIQSYKFTLYNLDKPGNALSDHQGVFSRVNQPQ